MKPEKEAVRIKLRNARILRWLAPTVLLVVFFVMVSIPLPDDIAFTPYMFGFASLLSFVVAIAETRSDVARDVTIGDSSLTNVNTKGGLTEIPYKDISQLVWRRGLFPQTHNGGCLVETDEASVQIDFEFFSKEATLAAVRRLHSQVPISRQKHWPVYCKTTALRLYFELENPDGSLSPPSEEEVALNKVAAKNRTIALLVTLGIGLVLSLLVFFCLNWLAPTFAVVTALVVFILFRVGAQLFAMIIYPDVAPNYDEAVVYWQTEAMGQTEAMKANPVVTD